MKDICVMVFCFLFGDFFAHCQFFLFHFHSHPSRFVRYNFFSTYSIKLYLSFDKFNASLLLIFAKNCSAKKELKDFKITRDLLGAFGTESTKCLPFRLYLCVLHLDISKTAEKLTNTKNAKFNLSTITVTVS